MEHRNKGSVTSLWSVIEALQRGLEKQGLSKDVVDVAVTQRLRAVLSAPPRRMRMPIGALRSVKA